MPEKFLWDSLELLGKIKKTSIIDNHFSETSASESNFLYTRQRERLADHSACVNCLELNFKNIAKLSQLLQQQQQQQFLFRAQKSLQ